MRMHKRQTRRGQFVVEQEFPGILQWLKINVIFVQLALVYSILLGSNFQLFYNICFQKEANYSNSLLYNYYTTVDALLHWFCYGFFGVSLLDIHPIIKQLARLAFTSLQVLMLPKLIDLSCVMSCMRVCRKQALSRVKYYYYIINSKIQQQQ